MDQDGAPPPFSLLLTRLSFHRTRHRPRSTFVRMPRPSSTQSQRPVTRKNAMDTCPQSKTDEQSSTLLLARTLCSFLNDVLPVMSTRSLLGWPLYGILASSTSPSGTPKKLTSPNASYHESTACAPSYPTEKASPTALRQACTRSDFDFGQLGNFGTRTRREMPHAHPRPDVLDETPRTALRGRCGI
jgi:hypothetical protein